MKPEEAFLQSSIRKFKGQKSLGEKTFAQLEEKDLFYKPSQESNSIAVIVHHIAVIMLSRWTNFLTEDGEKPWRERDKQFEDSFETKEQIMDAWNKGWQCVFNTMENLNGPDVMRTITIRGKPLLVMDAIIRQIDHYGYHVGQIVFIGKMLKDENWQTLSIAKRKSGEYNKQMTNK
jgi:hypothetical protein